MDKDLISTKYTKAAIAQIQSEVTLLSKIVNLIVQLLAMGYYGAMIYIFRADMFRVVLYSVLFALTLIAYAIGLVLSSPTEEERAIRKRRERVRRRVNLIFKLINYAARITAVSYAFYLVAVYGASDLTLILTFLSAGLILANAIIDGVVYLFRRYSNYIMVAVEADKSESMVVEVGEKVSSPWKTLSEVTSHLADKMEGVIRNPEPMDPSDEKIKGVLEKRADGIYEEAQERKRRKKEERKAANRAHRAQIKANLRRIFRFHKRKSDE